MKVGPHIPPPVPQRAAAPAATTPLADFAALLPTPGGNDGEADRAFGFAELGMFGVAHALSAPGDPGANIRSPRTPFPAPDMRDAREAVRSVDPGAGSPGEVHIHQSRGSQTPAAKSTPVLPVRAPGTATPFAAEPMVAAAADASEAVDAAAPGAPGGARARLRSAMPAANAIALILAGDGDRLELTAAAPELGDPARAALRRRLERIAARFGMTIGEALLNGKPLPATFRFGDHNGTRTR